MSVRSFLPVLPTVLLFAGFSAVEVCAAQSTVDILYIQQNASILTYNVNRKTLQAAPVGQPLAAPGGAASVRVFPAPNGHFLYILSQTQPSGEQTLSVYATDDEGVPQAPAVQTVGPAPISSFAIDPNGRFAYLFIDHTNAKSESTYELKLFTVNSTNGKLQSPQVEMTYSESSYCAPTFNTFSPGGNRLFDEVACVYHDSSSVTYYSRKIDPETGQLAPDVHFFSVNDAFGSNADEVAITPNTIIDFQQQFSPFQESLVVYPLERNPKTPLIDCTSAMLAACGEAGSYLADPSGQFLLMELENDSEIVKVDLVNKQIVATGSAIPITQQPFFSPDDQFLYGISYVQGGDSTIQIYGFDRETGALTTGGQISVAPTLWNIFPAVRR